MPKIRLSTVSRQDLKRYAAAIVTAPAEMAALEAAYAKAEPLVRASVLQVYPHKDMLICRKYEAAKIDDCINVKLTAGGVEQFNFKRETGPLVVKPTYTGKIYEVDSNTSDSITDWVAATDAHKQALKSKLADYETLIRSSRTLEDVVEVWPEAETLRAALEPRAIMAIGPEVVSRIRADIASRQGAA